MNSLLLFASLVFIFGTVLLSWRLFGKTGLYCLTAVATILANIEVVMLVRAFGMDQTLGNILFAATFLITDILSECESKAAANKAVMIGIFSNVFFLALSQSWLLYTPAEGDFAYDAFSIIFAQTPRLVLASLSVYIISQFFDVWLYHRWWAFTEKKFGDKRRYLWLRNNGSTLVSQLINSVLFNVFAFYGVQDVPTLVSICVSTYVIYIFTSLLDTPVIYLARRINDKRVRNSR